MKVKDLIAKLQEFGPEADVILVDLNGLHWLMEPDLVREEDGDVLIDSKDVNVV